jgi:hypothetical protein
MNTLHRRRRVGDTRFADPMPHARFYRAANDEPLDTSRELLMTLAAAAVLWLVAAGLLAWALHLLVV